MRPLLFSNGSGAYYSSTPYIRIEYPLPFLVPIILSLHIPLGACSKPVGLGAPITHHGISYKRFLLYHTNCDSNTDTYFYMFLDIDPYIRKFVSPIGHSHHGYFIDPRPIGCIFHRWNTFLSTVQCHDATRHLHFSVRAALSRLHRASDTLCFRCSMPAGVLGKAFPGVTPSFHLLDYQFS